MVPAGEGGPESLVGTTIAAKYFVHQLLGRGGMGDVYKATLLGADRVVALKLLSNAARADPTLLRRFEREAAAASRLRHPNTIELVDFGTAEDGLPYLATEFVPGRTLAQVIVAEAPLPAARTVHLLAQVLAALADAHARGVIHRDLKPANVMVDPLRDPAGFVKVLDFGIATLADPSSGGDDRLTGRDVVFGTPAYMSPEQIRGEPLDARSDLYSAGVMLFEMLSGVTPFEAPTSMAVAAKHLTDPAPRLADRRPGLELPPALEALLSRALQKDPAHRPGSAEEMRAELVASLAALPEPARAPPPLELPPTEALPRASAASPPSSSASRGERAGVRGGARRRAAAGAAAVAAAIAATLVLTRGGAEGTPAAPPPPASAAPLPSSPPAAAVSIRPVTPPATSPAPPARSAPRPPPPLPPPAARRAAPSARAASPDPRPAPFLLVRGELNSVPTPSADTGEGVLVLVATPWAELEVEGVRLGETPREVRLRAGTYGVRAVHPELGIREERVVVGPGERKLWAARYEP
jgi:serine/threonine protein kinase